MADANSEQWRERLGRFGVWRQASQVSTDLAARLERLGYAALWLGGSPEADLRVVDDLLGATTSLVVATGIVNIWRADPHQVAASYHRIGASFPGRFLLGVGVGHREAIKEYAKPYEAIVSYLDTLTAEAVPAGDVVLATLGPRMLRLAAERTAGAHPYLVPVDYTRQARQVMGPGPLIATEHKAVIESDRERAREMGRARVRRPYLGLVNYASNLRRLGWSDADLADPGSDALIDALVAHGNAAQVAEVLTGHLSAGADHVCVQLLTQPGADPVEGYAELAEALGLTA